MERIKISNSRGNNLSVVIHRPSKETNKLAILCPGFLDTKDYAHLVALSNGLAERGYTVARFDPSGTWESEGDISEYKNSQYLSDVKSVLDYMLSKGKFTHTLLGGHSRGGTISILYSARDPRITEVLVIMSASSEPLEGKKYEKWEKEGFSSSFRDIPDSKERREFRVPFSHVVDRRKFNVFEDVKNIHVPIVLIAGELDTSVPPEDVKRIFDLANEPKKFILMKGIGHDYRHNSKEIEMVNSKIFEAI